MPRLVRGPCRSWVGEGESPPSSRSPSVSWFAAASVSRTAEWSCAGLAQCDRGAKPFRSARASRGAGSVPTWGRGSSRCEHCVERLLQSEVCVGLRPRCVDRVGQSADSRCGLRHGVLRKDNIACGESTAFASRHFHLFGGDVTVAVIPRKNIKGDVPANGAHLESSS